MKEFTGYKRGVNLGGWLSQCTHCTENYETFITENDIQKISQCGLDHIRLPIDYELVCSANGSFIESGFGYIDRCLAWCEKYHLNMILDIHKTAGFSFDEKTDLCEDFFTSSILQEKFIELWTELARRYGNVGSRLSFELLNEVVEPEVADIWNDIIRRTIPEIRRYAPSTVILVGGVRNNSVFWLKKLDKPYDENVIYTFHFYEPLIFTHQSAYWVDKMTPDFTTEYPNDFNTFFKETEEYLPEEHREIYRTIYSNYVDKSFIRAAFADAVRIAEERGTCVYCGEYGVINKTTLSSALNWFSDINSVFEEFGIPRAVWTYKGKDFGITDEHFCSIFDTLVTLL